ncbi:MAG: helicase-related protein, partial [Myxococcota bacterium]|jgi:ATP-dependent Lhr-like helicase|nr:helicase-related protein [Myxococcota bacterium]
LARILITTPESLDSLLARRAGELRSLQWLFLDELHLLSTVARGDQLRCLVERLERLNGRSLQRCAASATLPEAQRLAWRFLGADALLARGASASTRPIEARLRKAESVAEVCAEIAALYHEAPGRKLLVFANARALVESISSGLLGDARLRGKVFAHHGSLSRAERLRVERLFLDTPTAICVATMTLELGIDIGDVDRVVLLGPPPDVSSLLQRVGRANRGGECTQALGLYANRLEQRRFEHLLECASAGKLFTDEVAFRPTAIAQQSLSLLFQNPKRWISAQGVFSRLPEEVQQQYSLADCESVLQRLGQSGWLRQASGGRWVAEDAAQQAFRYGRLHSLIRDTRETEVIDELTGRTVGRVRLAEKERSRLDGGGQVGLALGGRSHVSSRFRDERLYVRAGAKEELSARFSRREAARYSVGLARDFARFLGIGASVITMQSIGEGSYRVGHFMGSVWGVLFVALLEAQGYHPQRRSAGPFFVDVERWPDGQSVLGTSEAVLQMVGRRLERNMRRLSRALQPGAFQNQVPELLLSRWVQSSVDLPGFAQRVSGMRLELSGEVP